MTPEAKVKAKIKKILLTHDIWYAMPHGAGYGNAGIPDFLCCHKGKFIAIEAKANEDCRGAGTKCESRQVGDTL
jgi:hypothetical protein